MTDLQSLIWAMEEARVALQHARGEASKHHLECTDNEISRALSHVESVLFEIERKIEPEFAPFRHVGRSPG